ncbi:MAG: nucleoside hydrolase [Anaerolineae bacterium]|nr:nucleoside hydrolase [Anaerolineae bacterium]
MAMDDWMAILYLLQRPDVEVRAVTLAGTGEAHCDPGVRNAMNLLQLAGNPDVPVACGRETPLLGNKTFPQGWRDAVDVMLGLTLPENPNTPVAQTAVELLQQTINQSEGKTTLVVLGPLTNIAELLQADPAIADHITMIYVVGGAVNVPGNLQSGIGTTNTSAEWNIYIDPLAAAQVIESGVPVTLVALDATNHVPMTMAFVERLAADRITPEADFVYQVLGPADPSAEVEGYYFWDPLAAAVATDEGVVTIEEQAIRVITETGREYGRTAPDEAGTLVRVAVDADADLFEQVFLNVLNGRDPSAPLPVVATTQPEPAAAMTPVASADDIIGSWRWQTDTFHFQFRADGEFRADLSLEGLNSDSPEDLGTFQLEGGVITLTSGGTTQVCDPGDVGVYALFFTPENELVFVVQEDACYMREAPPAPQYFDRVE